MHEHDDAALAADAVQHMPCQLLRRVLGGAGIAAGHVPVVGHEAAAYHFRLNVLIYGFIIAIDAAAGKTEAGGRDAGGVLDEVEHLIHILQEGLHRGIDLFIGVAIVLFLPAFTVAIFFSFTYLLLC